MSYQSKLLWLEVLEHFDKKRYFQNGLTIPFLIGAEKYLSERANPLTVEDFLKQIIDKKTQQQITMQ